MTLDYFLKVRGSIETDSGVIIHEYYFKGEHNLINAADKIWLKSKDYEIEQIEDDLKKLQTLKNNKIEQIEDDLKRIGKYNLITVLNENIVYHKFIENKNYLSDLIGNAISNIDESYVQWYYEEFKNQELKEEISKEEIINQLTPKIRKICDSFDDGIQDDKTLLDEIKRITEKLKSLDIDLGNSNSILLNIKRKTFDFETEAIEYLKRTIKEVQTINYTNLIAEVKKEVEIGMNKIVNHGSYQNIQNSEKVLEEKVDQINKIEKIKDNFYDELENIKKPYYKKQLDYVQNVLEERIQSYEGSVLEEIVNLITFNKHDISSYGEYKYISKEEGLLKGNKDDYSTPFTFGEIDEGLRKILGTTVSNHQIKHIKNVVSSMRKRNIQLKNKANIIKKANAPVLNALKRLKQKSALKQQHIINRQNIKEASKNRKEAIMKKHQAKINAILKARSIIDQARKQHQAKINALKNVKHSHHKGKKKR